MAERACHVVASTAQVGLTQVLGGIVNSRHALAIACFAVAFVFYFAAWKPGAYGLGALGMLFELGAWISLLSRRDASNGEES